MSHDDIRLLLDRAATSLPEAPDLYGGLAHRRSSARRRRRAALAMAAAATAGTVGLVAWVGGTDGQQARRDTVVSNTGEDEVGPAPSWGPDTISFGHNVRIPLDHEGKYEYTSPAIPGDFFFRSNGVGFALGKGTTARIKGGRLEIISDGSSMHAVVTFEASGISGDNPTVILANIIATKGRRP